MRLEERDWTELLARASACGLGGASEYVRAALLATRITWEPDARADVVILRGGEVASAAAAYGRWGSNLDQCDRSLARIEKGIARSRRHGTTPGGAAERALGEARRAVAGCRELLSGDVGEAMQTMRAALPVDASGRSREPVRRSHMLSARLQAADKENIERRAREAGYRSVAGFARDALHVAMAATAHGEPIPGELLADGGMARLVKDALDVSGRRVNDAARTLNAAAAWATRAIREGAFDYSSADMLACVASDSAAVLDAAAASAREDFEWVMDGMRGATVLWSREKAGRRNDGRD